MKSLHEKNLNKIYLDWVKHNPKFKLSVADHQKYDIDGHADIEVFCWVNYDKLTSHEKKFLTSLINVMAEIQNHERIPR
mgnify:CR=1 FL=1